MRRCATTKWSAIGRAVVGDHATSLDASESLSTPIPTRTSSTLRAHGNNARNKLATLIVYKLCQRASLALGDLLFWTLQTSCCLYYRPPNFSPERARRNWCGQTRLRRRRSSRRRHRKNCMRAGATQLRMRLLHLDAIGRGGRGEILIAQPREASRLRCSECSGIDGRRRSCSCVCAGVIRCCCRCRWYGRVGKEWNNLIEMQQLPFHLHTHTPSHQSRVDQSRQFPRVSSLPPHPTDVSCRMRSDHLIDDGTDVWTLRTDTQHRAHLRTLRGRTRRHTSTHKAHHA
jgi:hypothetical protein